MNPLWSVFRLLCAVPRRAMSGSRSSHPGSAPPAKPLARVRLELESLEGRLVPNVANGIIANPIWTSNGQLMEKKDIPQPDGTVGHQGDGGCLDRNGRHKGIDILAPEWEPVRAIAGGTVVSPQTTNKWKPGLKANAAGNEVVLKHVVNGKTYYTKYFHLQSFFPKRIQPGRFVPAGAVIGYVGRSGNPVPGGDAHLHLEIRRGTLNGPVTCPSMGPGLIWLLYNSQAPAPAPSASTGIAGVYAGNYTSTADNAHGQMVLTITSTSPNPNGNSALPAINGTLVLNDFAGQTLGGTLQAFLSTDTGELFGGLADGSFSFASGSHLVGSQVSGSFVFFVSPFLNGHGDFQLTLQSCSCS
jgi:murein DD-endopeptidase MepM/ murein hydrolase activator NlpD